MSTNKNLRKIEYLEKGFKGEEGCSRSREDLLRRFRLEEPKSFTASSERPHCNPGRSPLAILSCTSSKEVLRLTSDCTSGAGGTKGAEGAGNNSPRVNTGNGEFWLSGERCRFFDKGGSSSTISSER